MLPEGPLGPPGALPGPCFGKDSKKARKHSIFSRFWEPPGDPWGPQNRRKWRPRTWLFFFSNAQGPSGDPQDPMCAHCGTPKIGPGRSFYVLLGCVFLHRFFGPCVHRFPYFFRFVRPWVRIAIYSVLSTFPFSEIFGKCTKRHPKKWKSS